LQEVLNVAFAVWHKDKIENGTSPSWLIMIFYAGDFDHKALIERKHSP
jgi:hypothetical protein